MKNSPSSSSIASTASSATTGSTDSALRRSPRLAEKAAAAAAAADAEVVEPDSPPRIRVSVAYPVPVRSTGSHGGCIDQLLGLLVIVVMAAFGYVLIRDLSTLK